MDQFLWIRMVSLLRGIYFANSQDLKKIFASLIKANEVRIHFASFSKEMIGSWNLLGIALEETSVMRQFFAKSISSANRFFPRISPLDAAVVIYQLDVEIAHEAWRKTVIFKIFSGGVPPDPLSWKHACIYIVSIMC